MSQSDITVTVRLSTDGYIVVDMADKYRIAEPISWGP